MWGLVGVLAILALALGYKSLGPKVPNAAPSGNPPAIHEPALPSSGFTWAYRAYDLKTGHPQYFTRGKRVTVVMLMASWCLYCAYVDKYVWPTVIHTPGLALNLVDVSSNGGIGNPGPKAPAFSGHDNVGSVVNVAGMRRIMHRYINRFHLTQPNVHVFVEPAGMKYWSVKYFPTILFVSATGKVTRVNGGITPSQAQSIIAGILRKE